MKRITPGRTIVLITYLLLAFPLFYFVYKFGILLGGYEDAKSYFILFGDITSKEVPTPFNMRLLSSAIIHLLHGTGVFYSTECAIDAFPGVDKSFFFSNVLFNFIVVTFTCYSLFSIFTRLGFETFLSFCAGVVFLLGFGTLFYLMMPGVDSLSVLLFTWLLYFYLKEKYLVIPILFALIFQREYYFLVIMLMSLMDFFRFGKKKYHVVVFAVAAICWVIYFLLRKHVFMTPHWHYQTSAGFLMSALLDIKVDLLVMFRQSFMTMNIYFIYLLVLALKKIKGYRINSYYLLMTVLMFVQITILSIATTSGNNNGRYFYYSTPFFLYLILTEISPVISVRLVSAPAPEAAQGAQN